MIRKSRARGRLAAFLFVVLGLLAFLPAAPDAATLLPNGKQVFVDRNGAPLVGGTVYFYTPNTTTPKTTWSDAGQTTANPNPVTLDGSGMAMVYGSGQYRQVVYDISGNLIWDQLTQDVYGLVGTYWGGTSGGSGNAQTLTPSLPLTAYSAPLSINFIAGFTNTGATTVNVSGLGAKNIYKITSSGPSALTGGEITANNVVTIVYDGTQFQLLPPLIITSITETVNAQTGTTYAVLNGDAGKLITFSNTASIAVTLPQAGAASQFSSGWYADFVNISSQASVPVIITPVTSTINAGASLTLLPNQGTRIVSDGVNYQISMFPMPWVTPGTTGNVLTSDGVKWVSSSPKVLQVVYAQITTLASTGTAIPFDDTIPQITEGGNAVSVAITPLNSGSALYIEGSANLGNAADDKMTVALFQGTTANAIAATGTRQSSALPQLVQLGVQAKVSLGTTASTTFSLRYGASASTTYLNGIGGATRIYGGVATTWIKVTEISP